MNVIGFTGKKRSGKTTAVSHVINAFPLSAHVNFKDALIRELTMYFPELLSEIGKHYDNTPTWYDGRPWTIERLFKEKPPLVRALMRNFGTELRRKKDPDYWVKEWIKSVEWYEMHGAEIILVDDVRFLNEADAIRALGGKIIRIQSGREDNADDHQSEREMESIVCDIAIENVWGEKTKMFQDLNDYIDSIIV